MTIESRNFGALFLWVCIRVLIFIYKAIPGPLSDGWRKTTEVHHRTEQSKYIGSLFNLSVHLPGQKNRTTFINKVISLLSGVFSETPETRVSLKWKRFAVVRVRNEYADFTHVSFSGDGAITGLEFHPGNNFPLAAVQLPALDTILSIVMESYNLTRDLPDKKRPGVLQATALRRTAAISVCSAPDRNSILNRVLSSTWINFKDTGIDPAERNLPHWFYNQKNSGFGVFNIHCRHSSDYSHADLWVQFSHSGIDGRAAARLQGRIRKRMELFDETRRFPQDYPIPGNFIQSREMDKEVFCGCGFLDFTGHFVENNTLSREYGKVLPVAQLIWKLATQPPFNGKKFNVPVDVPGNEQHDRTVGFVFIQPKYFTDTYPGGEAFRRYVQNFNEQVASARTRKGYNYLFLESSLMVPHWMLILMLKCMRQAMYSLTGSVCVTIMEGIEYGIPSLSDNIDSIISISIPVGRDDLEGCVSVRSAHDNIKAIFEAVKKAAESPCHPFTPGKMTR
jgi:hypothetical protein